MNALYWLFILSVSLTLLTSHVVRADDDVDVDGSDAGADETYDDEDFDDDEDAVSSSDVTVKTYFPNFADGKKLPLGEEVTLLVAFNNNGEKAFNISEIQGHLHSPFDYNYYIQNFTAKNAAAHVAPNSQVSLEYTFTPDATLEALEFWFSAYVTYNRSDGRAFMHTLSNGTIELVESSAQTSGSLIMYIVVLGGLGGLGYIMTQSSAGSTKKVKKARTAQTQESIEENAASWDDEIYKPSDKQKRAGRKGNMRKK